ncbi:MAG TPA: TonB family protein [Terriglobales bacterium]|nr:TonB family protein [Terriglobales bacterium]
MQRSPIPMSSAIPPSDGANPWPGQDRRGAAEESTWFSDRVPLEILRRDAAEGRVDLDPLLAMVTESARSLTGASGAALALWSQGVFICRARSGELAPELGAKLDPETGLSGECLLRAEPVRCDDTYGDPRVDAGVCAELGLRSLLAVPLLGKHGVIGLLEVFSALPYAFATTEIDLLQQLGEIAVLGREGSAESLTVAPLPPEERGEFSGESGPTGVARKLVHAGRRLVAWVLREEGQKARLAVLGLLVAAILTWLGWILSRQDGSAGSQKAGHPVVVAGLPSPGATPDGTSTEIELSAPAPAIKPDPRQTAPTEETSAGDVVHRAAQFEPLPRRAPQTRNEDVAPPPASEVLSGNNAHAAESLGGIVATPLDLPTNGVPVSQGVTPGVLLRQVMPIYPLPAARRHEKETVVLDFVVGEDGQVRDLKVRSGAPPFTEAARTAVRQWHYSPYLLNGQPVAMPVRVNVVFNQRE